MKEFKYFLDSNIFLRPIVKDDIQKVKECERIFKKIGHMTKTLTKSALKEKNQEKLFRRN